MEYSALIFFIHSVMFYIIVFAVSGMSIT